MEIERNPVGAVTVFVANARHVAITGPARQISFVIRMKRRKAATGDNREDADVEGRGEQRIVSAERMTDAADPVRIDFRQSLRQQR